MTSSRVAQTQTMELIDTVASWRKASVNLTRGAKRVNLGDSAAGDLANPTPR